MIVIWPPVVGRVSGLLPEIACSYRALSEYATMPKAVPPLIGRGTLVFAGDVSSIALL